MPSTDTGLRAYYDAVLQMLHRIAREQRPRRDPSIRTSDIVQEVFLRLQPQLREHETVERLVPLAATIARRWVIDCARRRRPLELPQHLLEGAVRSLQEAGIDALDLEAFLAGLPKEARHIVDLRIFAGLDARDIIRVTGATEYSVRRTLEHARSTLLRLREAE